MNLTGGHVLICCNGFGP